MYILYVAPSPFLYYYFLYPPVDNFRMVGRYVPDGLGDNTLGCKE